MRNMLRQGSVIAISLIAILAAGAHADWFDDFDDGDISDWTIETPYAPFTTDSAITISRAHNVRYSPPFSLMLNGVAENNYGGRAVGPYVPLSFTMPYKIRFRFRVGDYHWYHMVAFGPVLLTLDYPSIRMRHGKSSGFGYLGTAAVGNYIPKGQWVNIEVRVVPAESAYTVYVNGNFKGRAYYGSYDTGLTRFKIQDNCGAQEHTDFAQGAYYDNISITQWDRDCNDNGILDSLEIVNHTAEDCNNNWVPDECEPDCNDNQVADGCDIRDGTSLDCNDNRIPDECEDCNENGYADECDIRDGRSLDCNENGIPDECDVAAGRSFDCNQNGILDDCEMDCNFNGILDSCDIADGVSYDCNTNGIPDECEADCDLNGILDSCDIAEGRHQDCNNNGIPDSCDIAAETSYDCAGNGIPDECDALNPDTTNCDLQFPGDVNGDCWIDLKDAPYLLEYLNMAGPPPTLIWNGDANGDCCVNQDDAQAIMTYLFMGGFPPLADCTCWELPTAYTPETECAEPTCCVGMTGDVDDTQDGVVDISDLTRLIDYLYISYEPLVCLDEADMDATQDGFVDGGDLTALIGYLFIPPFPDLPPCK